MSHHVGLRVDVQSDQSTALALAHSSQRLLALQQAVANLPPAPSGNTATDAGGSNAPPVVISAAGQALAEQSPSVAPDSVVRVEDAEQSRLRASQTTDASEVNFDFEVTTQDGDKVTVHVNLLDSTTLLRARGHSADGTKIQLQSSTHSTSRSTTISVEGSLDDGELAAIDKLAGSVVDLAQHFLQGDDRGAIDKALSLNFDASELTTFALHLSQQQSHTSTRVKLSGDAALQGLAQLDSVFAGQTQNIGDAIRHLINQSSDALDAATRAQVVQLLLPPLLGPVNVVANDSTDNSASDSAPASV